MSAGIPVIQNQDWKKQRHFQAPPIKWQLDSAKIAHSYYFLGKIAEKPNFLVLKRARKKKNNLLMNSTDKEPWETSKTEIYQKHGRLTHPHFRFL